MYLEWHNTKISFIQLNSLVLSEMSVHKCSYWPILFSQHGWTVAKFLCFMFTDRDNKVIFQPCWLNELKRSTAFGKGKLFSCGAEWVILKSFPATPNIETKSIWSTWKYRWNETDDEILLALAKFLWSLKFVFFSNNGKLFLVLLLSSY